MKDEIICGSTLSALKEMEAESIDCVITSPPYWSLRDYGIEGQLGLEPTFQEYIINLQEIFDEVYRVLKRTGNCWVNIGTTMQNKCDVMIPERFALGMVDHGWIKRRTVIWQKPSCMPSSVKDDFTNDFDYVYRFVKNKKYYFEQQFEAYSSLETYTRPLRGWKDETYKGNDKHQTHNYDYKAVAEAMYGGQAIKDYETAKAQNPSEAKRRILASMLKEGGRNKRAVWRINPQPFKDAHFAVFPEKLVEPMVQAGCPKDGIVLDPFSGSGTTALVARKLGRHYIGIDLNPDYCKMAEKRLSEVL